MLKFINTLIYTVFVALLLGVAGLLIGSMLPIPGNIELKIVKSGSMDPAIPTGSLVVVKPSASYGVGDVITFGADTRTEIPTTHRIIGFETGERGESVYRTKGDANEDQDANPVARSEIIGKVVFHLPYIGFVLDFARQPLGFALLIGVPAALVILEETLTIVKEVKAAVRRRRRGGDDDEGEDRGGTNGADDPMRLVYLRKRAMDEIFVPMMLETRGWMRTKLPAPKDAYASATFVVVGMVGVSTLMAGGAGGTIAYFSDIERSIGNRFAAGIGWELEAASIPQDFMLIRAVEAEPEPSALKATNENASEETPDAPAAPQNPDTITEEPQPTEEEPQTTPIANEELAPTTPLEPTDSKEKPETAPELPAEEF